MDEERLGGCVVGDSGSDRVVVRSGGAVGGRVRPKGIELHGQQAVGGGRVDAEQVDRIGSPVIERIERGQEEGEATGGGGVCGAATAAGGEGDREFEVGGEAGVLVGGGAPQRDRAGVVGGGDVGLAASELKGAAG